MYQPILAVLAFVLSSDRQRTLLIHRNRREQDQHLHKVNGLGGKVEFHEDIYSCLCRELREEAGIECEQAVLRGTISWPGFGPAGEDWFGFIFRVDRFSGDPLSVNEEGELVWHDLDELPTLPMWEGDRFFLPLVFDDNPLQFHGHMVYGEEGPPIWTSTRP
jgi:8-oxo-dGTP diphosphatase